MSMFSGLVINVVSNFIYDIVKGFKHKTQKKQLKDYVSENLNEDYSDLFDSGSFQKYINLFSTQTKITNFIKMNTFRTNLIKGYDVQDKNSFVEELSKEAKVFVYNETEKELLDQLLYKFFKKTLDMIELQIINDFPEELYAIPYFLNQAIDLAFKRYNESSTLNFESIDLFENTRATYTKLISERYCKNHIPGIDTLEFSQFYIFPKFNYYVRNEKMDKKSSEINNDYIVNWNDVFEISNIISIIGGPGFGKTLFLKNLLLNYSNLNILNSEKALPIYCNLKEFIENKKAKKAYSIQDFILDSMLDSTACEGLSRDFLNYFISNGRCLLLFDALDEVDIDEREKLCSLLLVFLKNINKNNKICITTRDRSLIPETPIILSVKAINIDDIKDYLLLMSKIEKFSVNDIDIFLDQCKPLIESNFLTNFLMIALMVGIFKGERKLPENKIDLYEKCVSYIARTREIEEKKGNYRFDLIHTIISNDLTFEKLSYLTRRINNETHKKEIEELLTETFKKRYSDENSTLYAINQFLKFSTERTELFVQGKQDHYRFFHRSFFEYYYSKYVIKYLLSNEELFLELLEFGSDSEIFELTIAYLKTNNYERYLDFLDEILLKVKNNKDLRKNDSVLQMVKEFMFIADEHHYLSIFYKLCFGRIKFLDFYSSRNNEYKLTVIIRKLYDLNTDFVVDVMKYYKEDFIAVILKNFDKKYIQGYMVTPMFIGIDPILDDILEKHMVEVVKFIDNLTFSEIKKACNSRLLIMDREEDINSEKESFVLVKDIDNAVNELLIAIKNIKYSFAEVAALQEK